MNAVAQELKQRKELKGDSFIFKYAKWLNKRLRKKLLFRKANECMRVAERICWMGFENPREIQRCLDFAKDNLYEAQRLLKIESENKKDNNFNIEI